MRTPAELARPPIAADDALRRRRQRLRWPAELEPAASPARPTFARPLMRESRRVRGITAPLRALSGDDASASPTTTTNEARVARASSPARLRRPRFVVAPWKCALIGHARPRVAPALASTRSVAPASPARRRGRGTRPTAAPPAPLNFFSLPELCAEGFVALGRRLGGVTQGTPMGPRNASRADSGPSRRAVFE